MRNMKGEGEEGGERGGGVWTLGRCVSTLDEPKEYGSWEV